MKRYYYLTPVIAGPNAPRFPISEHKQLAGRCESADIPLIEPTISRKHATMYCTEDSVFIEDLGSKHGTFVNSKRIEQCQLRAGDLIVFGLNMVMRLEVSNTWIKAAETRPEIEVEPTISQIDLPERRRKTGHGEFSFDRALVQNRQTPPPAQNFTSRQFNLASLGAKLLTTLPKALKLLDSIDFTELNPSDQHLIDQLRSMISPNRFHIEALKLEPIDLPEMIDHVLLLIRSLATHKRIGFQIDNPAIAIQSVPSLLQQSFSALIRYIIDVASYNSTILITLIKPNRMQFSYRPSNQHPTPNMQLFSALSVEPHHPVRLLEAYQILMMLNVEFSLNIQNEGIIIELQF